MAYSDPKALDLIRSVAAARPGTLASTAQQTKKMPAAGAGKSNFKRKLEETV